MINAQQINYFNTYILSAHTIPPIPSTKMSQQKPFEMHPRRCHALKNNLNISRWPHLHHTVGNRTCVPSTKNTTKNINIESYRK